MTFFIYWSNENLGMSDASNLFDNHAIEISLCPGLVTSCNVGLHDEYYQILDNRLKG